MRALTQIDFDAAPRERTLKLLVAALALGLAGCLLGWAIHLAWGTTDNVARRLLTALFEEPVKISLALIVAALFWFRERLTRRVVGGTVISVALAFAIYEHYTPAYMNEGLHLLALRILSHVGYPLVGLLMASWSNWPRVSTWKWLGAAILPHFLNNLLSVVVVALEVESSGWLLKLAPSSGPLRRGMDVIEVRAQAPIKSLQPGFGEIQSGPLTSRASRVASASPQLAA